VNGEAISAAWRTWVETEEASKALDPETLRTSVNVSLYLRNRIEAAYLAGVEAAEDHRVQATVSVHSARGRYVDDRLEAVSERAERAATLARVIRDLWESEPAEDLDRSALLALLEVARNELGQAFAELPDEERVTAELNEATDTDAPGPEVSRR